MSWYLIAALVLVGGSIVGILIGKALAFLGRWDEEPK